MIEENRTYITNLKVTDVPWHRLTTAYGRGTDFPKHFESLSKMDDLKSFTYVLAVAECKSISKAAELLYISQPSLSRFISSLEQELGILLFERKSNGISLTEAGEIYVEYGKEIKRLNSTMEHKLKELQLSEEQEIHCLLYTSPSPRD